MHAFDLLEQIRQACDFAYMEGVRSKDERISYYYDPERVAQLEQVYALCAREKELAEQHLSMPTRPQTVSWRLLLRHSEYCCHWADILILMAKGETQAAIDRCKVYADAFGKYELEIERHLDHSLSCRVLEHITRKPVGIILN